MSKIQRVSCFFRIIFQIALIFLPLFLIYGWTMGPIIKLFNGALDFDFIPRTYNNLILHTLTPAEKFQGFLLSIIPTAVGMYIIYMLIKLFRLYEKGEIFSLTNVLCYRNVGIALVVGQFINLFYEGLMGYVLTRHNPPGHRLAVITFDHTNFGILLFALFVILISWIMAEGCKLREEQQLTI